MAGPICYVCGDPIPLVECVTIPGHDPALTVHERCVTRLAADALHTLHRDVGPRQAPPVDRAGLSAREVQVLRLVASGRTNRETADALQLSEKRVRNIVSSIFVKLDVSNRTEAGTLATRLGLLD